MGSDSREPDVSKNRPILFTVDVESDWGTGDVQGVETVLPRLLETLERCAARATFFVVGNLASRFRGHVPPTGSHEVASHGMTHDVLTRMEPTRIAFEVEESKRTLDSEGYVVRGFRAPFLKRPRELLSLLERTGYTYDSSEGSVLPGPKNLFRRSGEPKRKGPVRRLGPSRLRDGITPFSMTYLRLYHPLGLALVPKGFAVFFCHLHEFLPASGGWHSMPGLLRKLHGRNSGEAAWGILEKLLTRTGRRFISCRDYLGAEP